MAYANGEEMYDDVQRELKRNAATATAPPPDDPFIEVVAPSQREMSPEIGKWAEAMANAMGEIVPPERTNLVEVKNREGKFLYSYRYADISQCWDAIRGPLSKSGLAVNQFPEMVGDPRKGRLRIETWITHKSGQWVIKSFEVIVKEPLEIQKVGGSVTYACRYCLEAIFGLQPPGYDDDASHVTHNGTNKEATVSGKAWSSERGTEIAEQARRKVKINGNQKERVEPPKKAKAIYEKMMAKYKDKEKVLSLLTGALRKHEEISDEAVWASEWIAENPLTDKQWSDIDKEVERVMKAILSPDEVKEKTKGKTKAQKQKEKREAREAEANKKPDPVDGKGFEPLHDGDEEEFDKDMNNELDEIANSTF